MEEKSYRVKQLDRLQREILTYLKDHPGSLAQDIAAALIEKKIQSNYLTSRRVAQSIRVHMGDLISAERADPGTSFLYSLREGFAE